MEFRKSSVLLCLLQLSSAITLSAADEDTCPLECTCLPFGAKGTSMDCGQKGLLVVPKSPLKITEALLNNNKITRITSHAFRGCIQLQIIDLSYNAIAEMDSMSFMGLETLEILYLDNNKLQMQDPMSVPEDILEDLGALRELRLHNNHWSLTAGYRDDLIDNKVHLELLTLDSPKGCVKLPSGFNTLKSLHTLRVYGGISKLENDTLGALRNVPLKDVCFNGGYLEIADVLAFSHLTQMKSLDLSNNKNLGIGGNIVPSWTGLRETTIEKLIMNNVVQIQNPVSHLDNKFVKYLNETNLLELNLAGNNLSYSGIQFSALSKLEKICLSNNKLSEHLLELFEDLHHLPELRYIDVSIQAISAVTNERKRNNYGHNDDVSVTLRMPPVAISINASAVFVFNDDNNVDNITFILYAEHMELLDLSENHFRSMELLYAPTTVGLASSYLGHLNLSHCNINELSDIEVVNVNVSTIDLSYNGMGPIITVNLERYIPATVKVIYLTSNSIEVLPPNMFANLSDLERIYLNKNNLETLNVSFTHLQNLKFVDLSDNNVIHIADHTLRELDAISGNHELQLNLRGNPVDCLSCMSWLMQTKVNVISECLVDVVSLVALLKAEGISVTGLCVLISVTITCVLLILIPVVYRYRWQIRYVVFILSRNLTKLHISNHEKCQYDAFVVYHHTSFKWIKNVLDYLEEGDDSLRLCVHHRDWLPGRLIEENVVDSVNNSHNTLVLLTKHFLESAWCEFELQMARMREIETKEHTIIVVALDDIPLNRMSTTLIHLRRTTTWLDWYNDVAEDHKLKHLKYALGGCLRRQERHPDYFEPLVELTPIPAQPDLPLSESVTGHKPRERKRVKLDGRKNTISNEPYNRNVLQKNELTTAHSFPGVNEPSHASEDSDAIVCSRYIDVSGGEIGMFGVKLVVPEGALTGRNLIQLSILTSFKHYPILDGHDAIICPVICCEPHGLQFRKPATLILPHCAYRKENDWKSHVLTSQTNLQTKSKWERWAGNAKNSDSNRVVFEIHHFTLYTVIGEPLTDEAQKWVELIAFSAPFNGELFNLRAYCVNDYNDRNARDIQKMLTSEQRQGGIELTSPKSLLIHQNGGDLEMRMDRTAAGWRVSETCSSVQKIQFHLIWHTGCGSCAFVLLPIDERSNNSTCCCRVTCQQIISPKMSQTLDIATGTKKPHAIYWYDNDLLDTVFPKELLDILRKMLDPELLAANNWQGLADAMGKTIRDVSWLMDERKTTGRSPTIALLQDWVEGGNTLQQFKDTMDILGRLDVIEEIRNFESNYTQHQDEDMIPKEISADRECEACYHYRTRTGDDKGHHVSVQPGAHEVIKVDEMNPKLLGGTCRCSHELEDRTKSMLRRNGLRRRGNVRGEKLVMRLTVIGATATGTQLIEQALTMGHEVIAIVRDPDSVKVKHTKLQVVTPSLFDSDELVPYLTSCDAVISCLDSEYRLFREITLYSRSARAIVSAMVRANITRLVVMSSWFVEENVSHPWYARYIIKPLLYRFLVDMSRMEKFLMNECPAINFTSIRLPELTDGEQDDRAVLMEPDVDFSKAMLMKIPRANVGKCLLSCVENNLFQRRCVAIGLPS